VTDPCLVSGVSVCADPSQYLFWDSVHPTTAGHAVLGGAFAAAVPEPETYALMLGGLALIGLLSRRRSAAASY
jgi:phospholipase/lecithinase/hemolysin